MLMRSATAINTKFMTPQQALATTRHTPPSCLHDAAPKLELRHSLHEEFITAEIRQHGRVFDLGARAHHGLLLELARARLRDRGAGLCAGEEGWMHMCELSQRLGLEPPHLNVHIHRIRRQLRKLGYPETRLLIERRCGCGELRVGVSELEISRL
jgi:hypothetical protein